MQAYGCAGEMGRQAREDLVRSYGKVWILRVYHSRAAVAAPQFLLRRRSLQAC